MAPLNIHAFDHLVVKCSDVDATLRWYLDVLGLEPVRVDEWRAGQAFFPSVRVSPDTIIDLIPRAGEYGERNVDHICLVADRASVDAIVADGTSDSPTFSIVDGPGTRYGARGDGWSVYVTDPDDNVVEIRSYD
ncbi:VOC family protein [Desertimonas flava]|uniref:VOC family protein n=1 Tax=Desertimonas flava TaxID=2064846 RepID=UPI000E346E5F|nr:VOC family protein [Desertimonas flava]